MEPVVREATLGVRLSALSRIIDELDELSAEGGWHHLRENAVYGHDVRPEFTLPRQLVTQRSKCFESGVFRQRLKVESIGWLMERV